MYKHLHASAAKSIRCAVNELSLRNRCPIPAIRPISIGKDPESKFPDRPSSDSIFVSRPISVAMEPVNTLSLTGRRSRHSPIDRSPLGANL
jgi:hypothetical protein